MQFSTVQNSNNSANSGILNHITSSPNYPQSNGQAERAVQTMKQRMASMQERW